MKRPSIKDTIAAVAAREPISEAEPPRNDVTTSSGDHAETRKRHDVADPIPAVAPRRVAEATSGKRPHTSFYASEAVLRTIRVLAAEDGVRPQEIFRQAMKAYFKTRGKDFDALDKT
jgi:hypothetical protein